MKKTAAYFVFVAAAILAYYGCSGTSDEVVTGTKAFARIFEPDGITPAAGAVVKIFRNDALDGRYVSLQTTSAAGEYYYDDLQQGTYNIWVERDSLVCFQNGIAIVSHEKTVNDDTLGCSSSITAIVGVEPQDDPLTVTIRITGLDKFFKNSDKNGRFTMKNMAEGKYTLLLESTLPDYTPTAADITVEGCRDDTLSDTLRLTFTGIPIVRGVHASCDTALGTIRLAWQAASDDRYLQDYVIFRDPFDSANYSKDPLAATTDTVFYDTIFRPDRKSGRFSKLDTNEYRYKYRVAMRNNVHTIGPTFRFTDIVAASPSKVRSVFAFSGRHIARNITFAPFREVIDSCSFLLAAAASVNDSIVISACCSNATRSITELTWFDDSGTILRSIVPDSAMKSIADSLRCIWPETGLHRIVCAATDESGCVWSDTARIAVVTDAPGIVLSAGDSLHVIDTAAGRYCSAFGDTVPLHLNVTDRFGSIVNIAWGFGKAPEAGGSGTTTDTFTVISSASPETNAVFIRVTDDDGMTSLNTLYILAGPFAPVVRAAQFKARMYHAGAVFNDRMWIFGGVGIAQETPRMSYTSFDDAWISEDGIRWTPVSSNIPGRSGHEVLAFDGKLWLIGGYASSWGAYKNDVWSSTDGVSWTCVVDSALFSPRIYHTAVVFGGKIWVLGGLTRSTAENDVWSSVDGVEWVRVADNASFPPRSCHSATVFGDQIWIIGGRDTMYNPLNDVWSSSDGEQWRCETADAPFSPRQGHTCLTFGDTMWLAGGYGFGMADMVSDMWSSRDGITWIKAADSLAFAPRAFHRGLVFRDRFWIIGGITGNSILANDVWRSGVLDN